MIISPVEADLVADQLVEPVNTFQLLLCLLLFNTKFVSFAPVTRPTVHCSYLGLEISPLIVTKILWFLSWV